MTDKPIANGPEKPEAGGTEAWRFFDCTLAEVRACFADIPPEALQDMIAEATESVRL